MFISHHRKDGLLRDKLWRLQHLYRIKDKTKNRVKLRFNAIQRRIINALLLFWQAGKPIRHFDLKYRQGGVSTLYAIIYLDETAFHKNVTSGIIAQQRNSLNHIWEIVRFAHESMPTSVRPELKQDTAHTLAFKHLSSKILVDLKILSTGLHNLHISEYPLCAEDDIRQTIAACPPTANITFEGVGEGMNHAYDKYFEMKAQGLAMFHPWFIQEEYRLPTSAATITRTLEEQKVTKLARLEYGVMLDDGQILFRRQQVADLKELFPVLMAEDDRSCFLTSGNPFFSLKKMEVIARDLKIQLGEKPARTGDGWETWEEPTPGHQYAAGADVAEGLDVGGDPMIGGRDFSVLGILCVTCRRQAFRYRARIGVDAFYRTCDRWGRAYNQALLGVELNNHGHAVILGLREACRYPNLYKEDEPTSAFIKSNRVKKDVRYGWVTSGGTKATTLEQFRQAVEGKFEEDEHHFTPEIEVRDLVFLQEAFTFKNLGGILSSDAGRHDDTVMAWAIAYQMYLRVKGRSIPSLDVGQWKIGGELESRKL